jgi:hypothetical protein
MVVDNLVKAELCWSTDWMYMNYVGISLILRSLGCRPKDCLSGITTLALDLLGNQTLSLYSHLFRSICEEKKIASSFHVRYNFS